MKIYNEILDEILNQMPSRPPEAGGIIGGKKEQVCLWEYDAGHSKEGCFYCPNVNFLNKVIETWIDQGYDFMGILHVHFGGSKNLSDGDKKYIKEIMRSMPEYIEKLYFPIVVQPEKQVFSYIACRNFLGEIAIDTDEVEVII